MSHMLSVCFQTSSICPPNTEPLTHIQTRIPQGYSEQYPWGLFLCPRKAAENMSSGLSLPWFEPQYPYLRASQVALVVKNPPANAGDIKDAGSTPGSGRSPGGGQGSPSSILAWKIPWTEEPGGLPCIGLQRVGHDWRDWACMHACMHSYLQAEWSLWACIYRYVKWVNNSLYWVEYYSP